MFFTNTLTGWTKLLCAPVSLLRWWWVPASLQSAGPGSIRHTGSVSTHIVKGRLVQLHFSIIMHAENVKMHICKKKWVKHTLNSNWSASRGSSLWKVQENHAVRHTNSFRRHPVRNHYVEGVSPHVHLECTVMSKVSVFRPQDDPFLSKGTREQSAGLIKRESRSYQRSALLWAL